MVGTPIGGGKTSKLSDIPSTLELSEGQLPQIKNWKIGGKYKIVLEVEQIQASKGYDGKGPHSARFNVISASSAGESKAPSTAKPTMPSNSAKLAAINNKAKEA